MKLKDFYSLEGKFWKPRKHIKKQRHYFVNRGPSSQDYGFSSVYVWCKSWTINKAECWRIYAFELCCWRRLLRVPWTTRRCNQSILKEISPGCSLEGLTLKLKLQYFGHLMHAKSWLIWKDSDGGKGWRREKGVTEDEMVEWYPWLNGHEFDETPGDGEGQRSLACCSPWGSQSRARLSDWTTTNTGLNPLLLLLMSLLLWGQLLCPKA